MKNLLENAIEERKNFTANRITRPGRKLFRDV